MRTAFVSERSRVYIKGAVGNSTAFNAPGRFRFRPLAGKVKCGFVEDFPDVQYDSSVTSGDEGSASPPLYDWYQFRVRLTPCQGMAIFEGEQVNSWDIAVWLNDPFEVNADGEIDSQDYADMLDAYAE